MDLPTIFCPRLSEERYLFILRKSDSMEFINFGYILASQKAHLLFKVIFRASELPQRTKFDMKYYSAL